MMYELSDIIASAFCGCCAGLIIMFVYVEYTKHKCTMALLSLESKHCEEIIQIHSSNIITLQGAIEALEHYHKE